MKNEITNLTLKRKRFNEKYNGLNDSEIQKEILFTQRLSAERLESIRKNTSTLILFLIVIPIIVGIVIVISS